jgi:hypothetical protein
MAYLACCVSRHFYHGRHRLYLAPCFCTYKLPNPKSSNPFLIYQDLYYPWKDKDQFDKYIAQTRLNIRKGVQKQYNAGVLDSGLAKKLKRICNKVELAFFYPVVYRVNLDLIPKSRQKISGSGLVGSDEIRIDDLDEHKPEFDLLFLDFNGDSDFDSLKTLPIGSRKSALAILLRRCKA